MKGFLQLVLVRDGSRGGRNSTHNVGEPGQQNSWGEELGKALPLRTIQQVKLDKKEGVQSE